MQEFAGDILGARAEWAHLYSCHWRRRHGHRAAGSKTAQPHLIAVLERMSYRAYSRYKQRLNAACYIVIAYLSGMRDR